MLTIRFKLNNYMSLWVIGQAGPDKPFKTHNQYIEDLIRKDMQRKCSGYNNILACGELTGEQKADLHKVAMTGLLEYNQYVKRWLAVNPTMKPAIDAFTNQIWDVLSGEVG